MCWLVICVGVRSVCLVVVFRGVDILSHFYSDGDYIPLGVFVCRGGVRYPYIGIGESYVLLKTMSVEIDACIAFV